LKSRDRSHSCARSNPDKEALMLDSSFRWNDKALKRYQYLTLYRSRVASSSDECPGA